MTQSQRQLEEAEGALIGMGLSALSGFIAGALVMAYFFEIWC